MEALRITFVVASNNRQVLEGNLLRSRCFDPGHPHELIVQERFESAAKAFNDALGRAQNDLVVFVHQDIVFPKNWLRDLSESLRQLRESDPNWGVLGCYGEPLQGSGKGYIFESDRGPLGTPSARPEPVQTLDEIVLILRRSSGLRFSEEIPHFHFYGPDICLNAAVLGMQCYAISAPCLHNAQLNLLLPPEFFACYHAFKRRWNNHLPVRTTCIMVTEDDANYYRRRLQDFYLRYIRRVKLKKTRVDDVGPALASLEALSV